MNLLKELIKPTKRVTIETSDPFEKIEVKKLITQYNIELLQEARDESRGTWWCSFAMNGENMDCLPEFLTKLHANTNIHKICTARNIFRRRIGYALHN